MVSPLPMLTLSDDHTNIPYTKFPAENLEGKKNKWFDNVSAWREESSKMTKCSLLGLLKLNILWMNCMKLFINLTGKTTGVWQAKQKHFSLLISIHLTLLNWLIYYINLILLFLDFFLLLMHFSLLNVCAFCKLC